MKKLLTLTIFGLLVPQLFSQPMQTGLVNSRQKLTGRLYFAQTGQPYVDLGNVELTKAAHKIGRGQLKSRQHGRVIVSHEEPGDVDWRWNVKLTEFAGPGLALLRLAKATAAGFTNTIEIAVANTNGGWSLGYAVGTPFFIGLEATNIVWGTTAGANSYPTWNSAANSYYNSETGYLTLKATPGRNLANPVYLTYTVLQPQLALPAGSQPLIGPAGLIIPAGTSYFCGLCGATMNTDIIQIDEGGGNHGMYISTAETDGYPPDFSFNSATGMITAINQLGDGVHQMKFDNITAPALGFWEYTVLSQAFCTGSAKLCLFDQNTEEDPNPLTAPREIVLMSNAEIATTEWPQDDGNKWAGWTVELLSTTPPTVQDRK